MSDTRGMARDTATELQRTRKGEPMTHHDTMLAAFNVVDPTRSAFGIYPALDWKAPIALSGSHGAIEYVCKHHKVTLSDVLESVEYFTATAAVVIEEGELLHIRAPGYRAGPAGDH